MPGTSSAFAERIIGGYYLDIEPDRRELARYGLMIGDVQQVVSSALGAETVTTTVEGRERYGVSVRYPRDVRSDPQAIAREVLVPLPNGASIPLGQVAKVTLVQGPASIRTENAQLAAYIFVDARDRDLGSYVADAKTGRRRLGQVPARLLRHLERAVRILRARQEAARRRRAADAADHPAAALSQLPPHDRDADRHAVAAVRARRRALADVVDGLQSVGRRRRRLHRARRRRRRDRRHHADLSRPRLGGAEAQGASPRAAPSPAPTSPPRSWKAPSSACARR